MRKPHLERSSEIIQSTLELAAEQGVQKVTTHAIANRVGIAQPTIFRHFKTRDAILRAVIDWASVALFRILEGVSSEDVPAEERLERLLGRQFAFVAKHKGMPRLLFSERLHLEDPKLKAAIRRVMNTYATCVGEILRDGVAKGRFREDLEPEQTACFIVASIQGLLLRWSICDFCFSLEDEGEALWPNIWSAIRRPDGSD